MSACNQQLTISERKRLRALEAQIQAGLQITLRTWQALLEINRDELYRETHATFEAYCRDRWAIGRAHAYRLIEAAEVAADVSPIGDIANEAQARALAPLDAEGRLRVYGEATAGGTEPTTAAHLHALAAQALAHLPPEQQQDVIEAQERRVQEEARQVGGEGRGERLAAVDRALRKAIRLASGLGDEAEQGIQALEQWRAWFAGLDLAAA